MHIKKAELPDGFNTCSFVGNCNKLWVLSRKTIVWEGNFLCCKGP